jgi:hypothetical protein
MDEEAKNEKNEMMDDIDKCVATCGQTVVDAACMLNVMRSKLPLSERNASTDRTADLVIALDGLCQEHNDNGVDPLEIMTALLYLFIKTHEHLEAIDPAYCERIKWVHGVVSSCAKPKDKAEDKEAPYERRPIPYDPSVG